MKKLVEIAEVTAGGQPSNSKNPRKRCTTDRSIEQKKKKKEMDKKISPASLVVDKTGRSASTRLSTW